MAHLLGIKKGVVKATPLFIKLKCTKKRISINIYGRTSISQEYITIVRISPNIRSTSQNRNCLKRHIIRYIYGLCFT